MRRSTGALAVMTLVCTAIPAIAQEPFRVSVDVERVTLDVYVDDPSGRPITDLEREDFIALEDGEPREILNFASAETPYNILLLFDRSSSTQDQWPFLIRAVSRFVSQLPDHHRLALAAFDDKQEMLLGWRGPRELSRQAFTILSNNGGTRVYEALEWATDQLRQVEGRKGVIVFSDGVDNRLSRDLVSFDRDGAPRIAPPEQDGDFQRMLRSIGRIGAPVYFVAVNTDRNPDPGTPPNTFDLLQRAAARTRMELTAERSSGRLHLPRRIDDVVPLYEQIGRELGNSYSIAFAPGKSERDGIFRRIEIRVRNRTLRVTQSRQGYYAR